MLGIIITYFNYPEILPFQIKNIKKHVKTPYKIYVVDDSNMSLPELNISGVQYIRSSIQTGNPSQRHQNAVNLGMTIASLYCDNFLIFDNDMIFLTDFHLPEKSFYLPTVSPVDDTIKTFPWLNLLYTSHYHFFDFIPGSDSGGNFPVEGANRIIPATTDWEFVPAYFKLCKEYNIGVYFDILNINGAIVFHFRAMSNYCKFSEDFMNHKRLLILDYLSRLPN